MNAVRRAHVYNVRLGREEKYYLKVHGEFLFKAMSFRRCFHFVIKGL